jgi:hypothetical protein
MKLLLLIIELVFFFEVTISTQLDSMNRNNPFTQIRDSQGSDIFGRCRLLEKLEIRTTKQQAHLMFHVRCKSQNLIPNYLKVKVLVKTPRGYRLITKFHRQLLLAKISQIQSNLRSLRREVKCLNEELTQNLDVDLFSNLRSLIIKKKCRTEASCDLTHLKKLRKLGYRPFDQNKHQKLIDNHVLNLSKKTFTQDQLSVLALSPQHNLPNISKYQKHKVASQIEMMVSQCPEDIRDSVRSKIINVPIPKNIIQNNLPKNFQKILKSLKMDKEICILQADKGNTTVILDTASYEEKMLDILSDSET